MATSDSTGSQGFFGTIIVTWSYNAAKQELTVTGTLSGKAMNIVVLKPGNKTGTLTGQNGSNTATVGLDANFPTDILAMDASQTDPARNGQNSGGF